MTIRVSQEIKLKLEKIAGETRRSKSFLAAEAVSDFVEREIQIIQGIRRGLDDMEVGRVVPHDQVVAEARMIIVDAKKKSASR